MAEVTQFNFSYQEVVEALIKKQGLHEGIWVLTIEFGLGAGNIGPDENSLNPSAVIAVGKIGIKRADKITNLSVDASVVNPS